MLTKICRGRSLIQTELTYKTTTAGLHKYLQTTKDWMMKLVRKHKNSKKLYSIAKESRKYMRELNIEEQEELNQDLAPTKAAKAMKQKAKSEGLKNLTSTWEEKPLHGQYSLRANKADVDQKKSHQWLCSSGLKAEIEGLILAAQDQCLLNKNYQAKVIKNGADPRCHICTQYGKTIDHLISGYPTLAPNEYLNRHTRVAQYLLWKICKYYGAQHAENWYEHHPEAVTETDNVTILWNHSIPTDRKIQANKADITVKDKTEKTCKLIDAKIPADKNVSVAEFEKLSKYKDLEIEVEKLWHMKTVTIPVVIGALDMIKKGTEKHLEKIPESPNLGEQQKITLTGTAHILRKTLSI